MKSSADSGILDRAVGELARQRHALERALAPRQLARLAGRLAGARGRDRLRDDLPRVLRVLLEELGELLVDDLLDEALDRRVAELRLRLALELRVAQLDRDHGGEPLADVLALEVVLLLLQQALLARIAVDRARERGAEAREVGPALVGVDVVREREDRLDVGGVPLHRHLDRAVVVLALEEDDVLVDGVLGVVDVGDEVPDPALGVELVPLLALALVDEDDPEAARQEGRLAQALDERRRSRSRPPRRSPRRGGSRSSCRSRPCRPRRRSRRRRAARRARTPGGAACRRGAPRRRAAPRAR